MGGDKWFFFLIYMEKRTVNIKLGAVPRVLKVERILAAVFKEGNDYKLERVEVKETVLYWGYCVEIRTQRNKEEIEMVPNTIALKSGRDFNVIMKGRLPEFH